jgi:ABC-type transport system involved in cytochrome bd biosynthesis fused ATPase/permease subunit
MTELSRFYRKPQFEDLNHFAGYLVNKYPMAKIPPASAMHMGKVKIQANAIFLTVADWIPLLLAAIVPATPLESTWVVLTGSL